MQKSSSPDSLKPAMPDKPRNTLFTWHNLGRCLIALAVLATLIGLFYAEEDWRGHHAWEKYKREAEARGVVFDWQKFIPAPVPDDQNFTMTPFLAPLFDFAYQDVPGTPWRAYTTLHRDTNGINRTQDFATNLMKAIHSSKVQVSTAWYPQMNNLVSVAAELEKKQNPATNSNPNYSRTEAATLLLEEMKPLQPVLDEIRTASQRPYCRFNVHYEDKDLTGILLPHLAVIKKLAQVLQIRASAELTLGNSEAAAQDVELMLYLADSVRNEPLLISQLVRLSILSVTQAPIWEGLAQREWNDAQLQAFQKHLAQVSPLQTERWTISAERAGFGVAEFDLLRQYPAYLRAVAEDSSRPHDAVVLDMVLLSYAPSGWLYLEQLTFQHIMDEESTRLLDTNDARVHPQVSLSPSDQQILTDRSLLKHNLLANLMIAPLQKTVQKFALGQTVADEAVVACALERYRLTNGKYPEKLEALAPKYLEKVPVDVCSGQPLKYRRTDDSQFVLYSVGWNEKDEGGKIAMTANKVPHEDVNQGDWVWPAYPGSEHKKEGQNQ